MSKPIIKIHNVSTDEVIEREMTAAEFKQYEANQAAQLAEQSEAQAKAQAKTLAEGKLAALGLTTNDLRALGF